MPNKVTRRSYKKRFKSWAEIERLVKSRQSDKPVSQIVWDAKNGRWIDLKLAIVHNSE